ncbi:MAG: alpha-2-macroglobulin family protein, partial [candidate division Zixibacteria bacterium]|nr:alpha-2-macroglobulin family protein [candidate division Zixibacteria bacterium]
AGFLVEEFMPDRIKVTLTTADAAYRTGEMLSADVDAKFLFGPPAAGHQVSGHLTIEPYTFAPQGWTQYSFVNSALSFTKMEINLPDSLLDDTGGHTYTYQIPEKLTAPSALKGLLSATVSEQGGRGVSAYTDVVIHPYERYVGLRLNLKGYAKLGTAVSASLIAVGNDGKPVALPACDVRFYRVVYNTILKKDQTGVMRYVSERKTLLIDSTVVSLGLDGGHVSFTPTDYGSYEIVARDVDGGHSSSADFYASGWGYAPWAMTSPDKIELELDKKTYESGEKGVLQVRAPFGGKLLVTIEKASVLEVITRDMKENTATLEIPIKRDYFPNAYITATIIRPAASLELNMPARAFGIVPLSLSVEDKRLGLTVTAPEVTRPKSTVSIEVQIPQARSADITVAVVDAGILQLTDFTNPDPIEFFYGKKQPGLKPYDMYSFIYPKVVQSESHLGPGDKMFAASRQRHVNPITARRVKSVALWSGLLKTDAAGKAAATFTLPEFNGKLVIMAVAAQNDRFGSAVKEMIVRDKIVIQESFPRFISPNDLFDGLVTLFNNTGAAADITVTVAADGPVEFVSPTTTHVTLEDNREGSAVFAMKAKPAPGKVSFTITARADGETATASLELANRPAQPLTTLFGSGTATLETPAEFTFPGDWLPTTDQYVLKTSSMPAVSFAKNIQYLLSYPYGCIEQTTSRLFPLLYFNDLVKVVDPGLFGGKGPDYFIQEGILRLTSMMLPDKSFAFWPGANYGNNWSTVYASHFLVETSRAGFYVDKNLIDDVRDHLDDMAQGKKVQDLTDAHRIYAAFALARTGKLSQRIVTYLKNLDPSTLEPYSRYQLAGALAATGNMAEALKLIPAEIQPNLFDPETGGNFSSGVRTDAILLDVLLDIDPNHTAIPVLAKSLMENSRLGRWYTTQDNAFSLMALGRYFKTHTNLGYTGTIVIDGDKTYPIDSTGFSLTRKDLAGRKVQVTVTSGQGACFYYWQASGIPVVNVAPEFDRGIKVRRVYLDENGSPVDLTKIKLGSQIVGVITAEAVDKTLSNVVINDLLPAGFEIENPRLKTTARLSWIPTQGAPIDFQDIRDDRLLIFASLSPGQPLKFYYSLRAVCAGNFKLPPVAAECMYNPLVAGSASSGLVTVVR